MSPPAEAPDDPAHPSLTVALPAERTVGDWVEMPAGTPVVEPINAQTTKWVAAFVDVGMAGWAMPGSGRAVHRLESARPDDCRVACSDSRISLEDRRLPASPEAAITMR